MLWQSPSRASGSVLRRECAGMRSGPAFRLQVGLRCMDQLRLSWAWLCLFWSYLRHLRQRAKREPRKDISRKSGVVLSNASGNLQRKICVHGFEVDCSWRQAQIRTQFAPKRLAYTMVRWRTWNSIRDGSGPTGVCAADLLLLAQEPS